MRKDRYEISLWEDYIVNATYQEANEIVNDKYYYFYNDVDGVYSMPILGSEVNEYPDKTWYELKTPEHYEEKKIGVIGSNSMTVEWRAREPKLIENINGSNTFTFKMFYTYIDTISGEKVENPFLKLLVNERKVKVLWKNKWYDLIIKNRQEDSNNKSITFTCKDLYINELSKTGFNLEFSNELMNNQGTAHELGERVLEGTDWQMRQSDVIRQKTEEPVYEIILSEDITVKNSEDEEVVITQGKTILVFYSVVQNKQTYFQFLYADSYKKDSSSMLVSNGEVYSAAAAWSESEEDGIKYNVVTLGNAQIKFSKEIKVSTEYRAERLVRQQLQVFDTLTNQYVYKYTSEYLPVEQTNEEQNYYVLNANNEFVEATSHDDDNETYYIHSEEPAIVYGYSDTVYNDATTVINLLSNNGYDGFSDTSGWTSIDDNAMPFGVFPEYTTLEEAQDFVINGKGFLFLKGKNDGYRYRNSGIRDSLQYLDDGFKRGEKYIFRYAVSLNDSNTNKPIISDNKVQYYAPSVDADLPIEPRLGIYNNDFTLSSDNVYFSRKNQGFKCVEDTEKGLIWVEIPFICKKTITKKDLQLTLNFGFIFKVTKDCWLREAQFFKYAEGEDKEGNIVRMNPNEIKTSAVVQVEYKYYNSNNDFKDQDEIYHLYAGLEPWDIPGLKPVYATKEITDSNGIKKIVDSFEQVRSIEGKQSNRFNLIQKIAETFECYAKFTIEHDEETGRIIYDDGRPRKFVSFHEEIGQRTGLGFIYGIDLKTISRTITSDQIVTKTIVIPNSNEFAKNGFCTIARANSNPSKQNFILNFDYYVSHGLLDNASLINDLYDTSTHIGYYPNLKKWSDLYDSITELYSKKKTELEKLQSTLHVYETYVKSGEEEITQIITDLGTLAGLTGTITQERVNSYLNDHPSFDKVRTLKLAWSNTVNNIAAYNTQIEGLNSQIDLLQQVVDNYDEQREEYAKEIEKLDEQFYNKYSRFIQEGSWTKEEYVDDELYYIDAQSVAYTSSRPQTQYNISVLRLSALDEFKHKVFKLGDIGYIQDTEFFGYTIIDNIKTPYKEEVLISEVTSNFDSPENDSFKVQNYKTQFEDLFQRITATTQQLQYAKGEYQKAANIVESDGTSIKASILQNTLALNQNIMISSQNNAFTQDSTGLTVTDVSNPNKKVKITSGGILFTNDGVNWKTGIDAAGMRADYLTTGSINTNNITVFSGEYPTFRWTSTGLDAYRFTNDGVDFGDFVRFDQYGIYGILNNQDFIPTQEDDIWDNASFGMTWKGFFVKNKEDNGWVEVSSTEDISVFKTVDDKDIQKIKIGRIGTDTNGNIVYGIKIKDDADTTVLETNDSGQLWLRDKLRVETYHTNNEVQIGKLDSEDTKDDIHGGRVIHADGGVDETGQEKEFVVYEDGHMKATSGEFTGTIFATGGKIGRMTIEAVENTVNVSKKLEIESPKGYSFKINNSGGSPTSFILTAKPQNFTPNDQGIIWQGSSNFSNWDTLATDTLTFELTYNDFKDKNSEMVYYIKAIAYDETGKLYESWKSFMGLSDGEKGEDTIVLVITSSNGNYFRNNQGSTTLTARLYKGGIEIDSQAPYDYTYTWSDTNDSNWNYTGKTLTVTAEDVNFNRTYICDVSKGG